MNRKDRTIFVRIEGKLHRALWKMAKADDRTLSSLCAKVLKDFVKNQAGK